MDYTFDRLLQNHHRLENKVWTSSCPCINEAASTTHITITPGPPCARDLTTPRRCLPTQYAGVQLPIYTAIAYYGQLLRSAAEGNAAFLQQYSGQLDLVMCHDNPGDITQQPAGHAAAGDDQQVSSSSSSSTKSITTGQSFVRRMLRQALTNSR